MIIKSPFFSLELVIPLLNSSYLLSKYKELIMKNELKLEYITVLYHISWIQETIYCSSLFPLSFFRPSSITFSSLHWFIFPLSIKAICQKTR